MKVPTLNGCVLSSPWDFTVFLPIIWPLHSFCLLFPNVPWGIEGIYTSCEDALEVLSVSLCVVGKSVSKEGAWTARCGGGSCLSFQHLASWGRRNIISVGLSWPHSEFKSKRGVYDGILCDKEACISFLFILNILDYILSENVSAVLTEGLDKQKFSTWNFDKFCF